MSNSASGIVSDENGRGVAGLRVVLEDVSRQFDVKLKDGITDSNGKFSFGYADDFATSSEPGKQIRQLRLRVMLGQLVLKEIVRTDSATQDHLTFDPIQLARAEAESWWATLGTGSPSRMTAGNAIEWLVDNEEGWGRVADTIAGAATLDIMQLQIDVSEHADTETSEKPLIVLRFDPKKPLDAEHERAMDADDQRIERLTLGVWAKGNDVRIQIPRMSLDLHGTLLIGVAVLGLASLLFMACVLAAILAIAVLLGAGAYLLRFANHKLHALFEEPLLANWFKAAHADQGAKQVRVRELKMRSLMVTHAKMVIDRGVQVPGQPPSPAVQAVLLGSPFEQVYFDTKAHSFDERRRGAKAAKGPLHDVSVGVRGPAAGHLQELFDSHWNVAAPDDQLLPELPRLPDPLSKAPDRELLSSVQIVRTLDRMFTNDAAGETGVLEAYLRAIHFAERFIYIENQYFNNDRITQALIDALAAKPALEVILLLNVVPDMPLYLGWQLAAIRRIAGSLGNAPAAAKRFGVFSTWSHAPSDATNSKPRLIDNYLHTKSALIDNRWATVGSANLDGASLDFVQYARAALDGDVRNTEANVVVFEEASAPHVTVEALRRRLWSEHLGFDSAAIELDDAPSKKWLELWQQRASTKLEGLKSNIDAVSPIRILPWPAKPYDGGISSLRFLHRAESHIFAKSYLQYLFSPDDVPSDVLVSQFEVIDDKGPPSFTFKYPSPA